MSHLPEIETELSSRDPVLAKLITSQSVRWPLAPTEDPIWGLLRIVMAQQISTDLACRLADRVRALYPKLNAPRPAMAPEPAGLRSIGLPQRRAECCAEIVRRSDEILARVTEGETWEQALAGIKGIGPWTIAVFRIMVLRDPDVLPLRDVGLDRAIENAYGGSQDVEKLSESWRPFRSVACWYLWRTLGNQQLG
jgi:DNA-3-methyladenine glycosylase II